MNCNCNCSTEDNNIIQFIRGTSVDLTLDFSEDLTGFTNGIFTIRENYTTAPIINKTIVVEDSNSINITLTPEETSQFTIFQNGKNSANYIWGFDLVDSVNNIQINVFPQTSQPAPLCIVYKHVVGE